MSLGFAVFGLINSRPRRQFWFNFIRNGPQPQGPYFHVERADTVRYGWPLVAYEQFEVLSPREYIEFDTFDKNIPYWQQMRRYEGIVDFEYRPRSAYIDTDSLKSFASANIIARTNEMAVKKLAPIQRNVRWITKGCVVDAIAAFVVLIVVSLLCEFWIRRAKSSALP